LKALIISADGVQDVELLYPIHRLQEAGYEVVVAAPEAGVFHGIQGMKFTAQASVRDVEELLEEYDLLVIPGGVKAMEKLRLNHWAIRMVSTHHHRGRVVAAMCSGAQMLISAKIVKGKRISAYYAMQIDVENAGAEFVDAPSVVDGNLVTSPHYRHLGPWMAAVLEETERMRALSSLEGKTLTGVMEEISADMAKWRKSAACAAAL
jgi:protease I